MQNERMGKIVVLLKRFKSFGDKMTFFKEMVNVQAIPNFPNCICFMKWNYAISNTAHHSMLFVKTAFFVTNNPIHNIILT